MKLISTFLVFLSLVSEFFLANSIEKMDVSFYSSGHLVKGWLYLPKTESNSKFPVIVMAPGFSGVKECNYQFFAENFTKEGFAVLLFDYPNFGESEGSFRGEIDPWMQVQAYRDGISFVGSRNEIDNERIGVWGGSYSGGHAIIVSALDERVKCMVAITPFISGSFYLNNFPSEVKSFLNQMFNRDRLARIQGEAPMMIPVSTEDASEFSAISSPNAWQFIQSFKDYAPNYKNSVTLKSLEMQLGYEPISYVSNIREIPKLFIIAANDEVVPEHQILDAFDLASEPKNIVYIEGNHFSPYMEGLKEASDEAIKWFKANL